jgi:hypothetical protein
MKFKHRKPDEMDYLRNLPIVALTLEAKWDPRSHYDDHGKPQLPTLESSFAAQQSQSFRLPSRSPVSFPLSSWNHSETCSVFQPQGETEDTFSDALQGSDKQFYGRAFHIDIPQHWRKHQDAPHIHFLRQFHVDEFLGTLSYSELLGFLPDNPHGDSYIFAVREANTFRRLCEDPHVFLDDTQVWFDAHSDEIGDVHSQSNLIGGVTTKKANHVTAKQSIDHFFEWT